MINKNYIRKIVDCCNENPMFRAGIFVESVDNVFSIFEIINMEYGNKNCEIKLYSFGQAVVRFQNGSRIFIGVARECCNSRGQRFHVMIVEDKNRSKYVYDCLAPCATLKSPDQNFGGFIWA